MKTIILDQVNKNSRAFAYRFFLVRADGKETLVTSHQPSAQKKPLTQAALETIAKDILAMPHWINFLQGQEGTVIARNVYNEQAAANQ